MMDVKNWYAQGELTSVNRLDVFFRRQGKGETLVCIHGFPSSSWDFEPLWPALTKRFDVIAPDLIGLGKSAKPKQAVSVSLQADMIESLLKAQGIFSAHILAHDLGDTVAQELLARQTNHSSSIQWLSCVFMNGGIFPETHQPLLIQKLLISPFGSVIAKLMSEKAFAKNMHRIFSVEHPPSEAFIRETWHLIAANDGVAMIPRLIRYMKERKTHRERWVSPLQKKIVPVRLIDGAVDPISGEHMAQRFREIVPNADIVMIANAGHYPHVETPAQVSKAFFEFHDAL